MRSICFQYSTGQSIQARTLSPYPVKLHREPKAYYISGVFQIFKSTVALRSVFENSFERAVLYVFSEHRHFREAMDCLSGQRCNFRVEIRFMLPGMYTIEVQFLDIPLHCKYILSPNHR